MYPLSLSHLTATQCMGLCNLAITGIPNLLLPVHG